MKKLNVLGLKVPCKIRKIPDELNLDGQSFPDGTIEIDPRCSQPYQVYCHENLHQLFDRLGIFRTTVHKDTEHIIIDAVATFMNENAVNLWINYNKLKKLQK
jgi:hypothetical protein